MGPLLLLVLLLLPPEERGCNDDVAPVAKAVIACKRDGPPLELGFAADDVDGDDDDDGEAFTAFEEGEAESDDETVARALARSSAGAEPSELLTEMSTGI